MLGTRSSIQEFPLTSSNTFKSLCWLSRWDSSRNLANLSLSPGSLPAELLLVTLRISKININAMRKHLNDISKNDLVSYLGVLMLPLSLSSSEPDDAALGKKNCPDLSPSRIAARSFSKSKETAGLPWIKALICTTCFIPSLY